MIIASSFKRFHACIAVLSAPNPQQATFDPCLCWRLLDPHGQIWVNLLWGHFLPIMLITHFQGLGLDIVISDIPFSLSFQLKSVSQIPKFQWTSNPLILPSFYCSSFLSCPCILLPILDSMVYHNLSLVLLSLQLGQNSNYIG